MEVSNTADGAVTHALTHLTAPTRRASASGREWRRQ